MAWGVDKQYSWNFDFEVKSDEKGSTDFDYGLSRDETRSNPLSDLAWFSGGYGSASDLV